MCWVYTDMCVLKFMANLKYPAEKSQMFSWLGIYINFVGLAIDVHPLPIVHAHNGCPIVH